jgi:hypothetical protein
MKLNAKNIFLRMTLIAISLFVLFPSSISAISITSPSDGQVNSSSQTLKGIAAPNSSVLITENDIIIASTVADGTGKWVVSISGLTDGQHSIKAVEIGGSYGYFSTLGEGSLIQRVLSGQTNLNPGGSGYPLLTTKGYLVPAALRPQGDAAYFHTGQTTDPPALLQFSSPSDLAAVNSFPSDSGVSTGTFNAEGTKVYFPINNPVSVSVVDYATNTVEDTIALPTGYAAAASRAHNGKIYVTVDDTLQVIDPSTNTIIKSIHTDCPTSAAGGGYVVFPRNRNYYYATCAKDGLIKKMSASDDSLIKTIDISGNHQNISSLFENFAGTKLYVSGIYGTSDANKVTVVDIDTGTVAKTITLSAAAMSAIPTADGQYLYVSTPGGFDTSNVDIISTQTDDIVDNIDTSGDGIPGVFVFGAGEEATASLTFSVITDSAINGKNQDLADTGQSQRMYAVLAGGLILVAAVLVLKRIKNSARL